MKRLKVICLNYSSLVEETGLGWRFRVVRKKISCFLWDKRIFCSHYWVFTKSKLPVTKLKAVVFIKILPKNFIFCLSDQREGSYGRKFYWFLFGLWL